MKISGKSAKQPTGPVQIDRASFPDQPNRPNDGPPCTVANVRHMLKCNGVTVRYNIIRKRIEIVVPWIASTVDNGDAVALTHILSLASQYGMPVGLISNVVDAIGDAHAYNPASDWIFSKPWDRIDRLKTFFATIIPMDDYPIELRDDLMRRWILSVTAAAIMPDGFHCRGVLTLQGAQGLGKTSWGRALIDHPTFAKQLIKLDHHLDASNKDSLLGAIEHWIVEIGELDSSLKRDVARLKGFLTNGTDKVRRPYGRVSCETQRRTVFYATVNAPDFLVDNTGNSRFWTIACKGIIHNHGIDMQQLFAQCAVLLREGEQWWLTDDEEKRLEQQNSLHRSYSLVRERILEIVDTSPDFSGSTKAMTASEVLEEAGLTNPTNPQAKECAGYLREWFGQSKRINGRDRWHIPVREKNVTSVPENPPTRRSTKFD
ncbi:VapE domain-containing protein [Sphingomonas sp. Leaf10]|uniref:VapE domain-containing protein n=1 Tax=Sphingomonas sp. Leaf10 TaxID=1735676 RepID=UPI0006FB2BE1|nr:VapE domain-containing protein [Sphingomonas sp. Leaf10]KQM35979.1 hypothetical protein ASE59_17180 [Sphingomonas sp. Leaf10]